MKKIFQKYVKLEIRSAKGKNEPLLSNISSCFCGYNPLVPFYAFVRRMMLLRLHAKMDNAVCIVMFSNP